MGFEKGNTYGTTTKRGKGKKTIAMESLKKLNEIGITPLETSNDLINGLLNNKDMTIDNKLKLLNITSSMFKYSLLTRSDEIKMDELQNENEILLEENQNLELTTKELLNQLKNEDK